LLSFLHFYERIALITFAASPTLAARLWQPEKLKNFRPDMRLSLLAAQPAFSIGDRWQQVSGGPGGESAPQPSNR